MGSPTLVFFQIVLVILIPLHFHINFQIRFLISKKFLLQLHWIYRSIWGDWHLNNIESSNPRTQCMSLDLFLSFKFHFQLFIASIKKYNWFLYTDLVSHDFDKLIVSSRFSVYFMGLSTLTTVSFMNRESFISSFQSVCLLLHFLALLHCPQLPVQYWKGEVRVGVLALFPILGKKKSVFDHEVWC